MADRINLQESCCGVLCDREATQKHIDEMQDFINHIAYKLHLNGVYDHDLKEWARVSKRLVRE